MTDGGTPLVLVADDEKDIRALVAFRLQPARYDVITAADGEEALTLATTRLPDLYVKKPFSPMDLQLCVQALFERRPSASTVSAL
jgi:DNA-binding response OmpR family regulator